MIHHKVKFIVVISILLLGGFCFTSFMSFFVSRASLRHEIENSALPLTSDNVYSEIQRDMIKPISIASYMAHDTFLRDWVTGGEKNELQIRNYLKQIQKKYNTVTSFFISDKTHNYYHPSGIVKKVSPSEPRDEWYFRVRNMKHEYETNTDPDMANNDTITIFVNYKVFDENGKFLGAAGIGLTMDFVRKLIDRYQEKYGRIIYFTDEKGNVILQAGNPIKSSGNIKNMPGISTVSDKILSSNQAKLCYTANGEMLHANTRFIPELDWYLIVEQTEEKALRGISKALVTNLIISVLVTIIMVLTINFIIDRYRNAINKAENEKRMEIQKAKARTKAKEIEIGIEIQNQLLSGQPPAGITGADVSAFSVPSKLIGGDFYDFFLHDKRHFDIFMGDVMGKGVPAALCGAATKIQFLRAIYNLTQQEKSNMPPLQEIISLARDEMSEKLINLESFITSCLARIDLEKMQMGFIDCGHTATMHFHYATGQCDMLKGENYPIGFMEEETYHEKTVDLAAGDVLLFYSDGIIEARDEEQNLFGTDRLMEFIADNKNLTMKEFVTELHKTLKIFSAEPNFNDDVTCIAIKIETNQ